MTTYGQTLSRTRQTERAHIRPFERAPRPMVGYAADYPAGHDTGRHSHPRAQLLHAIEGVMRVATDEALFIVPPGAGLWVPANEPHAVTMPAGLRMRALFLREDAARNGPARTAVIAVSPLLRELILAACEEGVAWDASGPLRHVAALALHEISRAVTRPLSLPAPRDPRLARVTVALLADPADARGLEAHAEAAGASARTLARLFRHDTGMSFSEWRRQLRLTEALVALAQGTPPEQAAASVGYASAPAFGAAFRAAFGTTPGRVRAAG